MILKSLNSILTTSGLRQRDTTSSGFTTIINIFYTTSVGIDFRRQNAVPKLEHHPGYCQHLITTRLLTDSHTDSDITKHLTWIVAAWLVAVRTMQLLSAGID